MKKLMFLVLLAMSATPAAAAGSSQVVVVNREPGEIRVFRVSGDALELQKILPAGDTPREVCISPDGTKAFVGNQKSQSVTVVNLNDLVVEATIQSEQLDGPDGCVVSPDSSTLYVTSRLRNSVVVVDIASGAVQHEISVPIEGPRRLVLSPDATQLFVGANDTPKVAIIDLSTNAFSATIDAGTEPRGGLAFTPDGKIFLVGNVEDDTVTAIDTRTHKTLSVRGVPISPQRIEVSPDGKFAYVLTRISADLFAMALTAGHDESKTIPLGQGPWGLAMSQDGTRLYVTNNVDNNILVLDTETFQVINDIPAGKDPNGIAIHP